MATKKPRPLTTQDALLRRIPGWKKPVVKAEVGGDGEPIPQVAESEHLRQSLLPDFKDMSDMITKDG